MKKAFFYATAMLLMIGLTNPAAAMDTDLFEDVQIHGFISQGFLTSDEYNYLAHNSTDGSFEYNEMGINFSKNMSDKLRIGMQFFSRDLGDASNNEITLDWAYADYRYQDWLGVRAGKIKLPLGFYNETRDVDMLRTSIVMPQGIYPDPIRDTTIAVSGVGIYGNLAIGAGGALDYQLIVGSFSNKNDSGLGKYVDSVFSGLATVRDELNYDTGFSGSLRWETPVDGLRMGYSFLSCDLEFPMTMDPAIPVVGGTDQVFDAEYLFQVASIEYTWNNLTLAAEYILRESDLIVLTTPMSVDHESYYLSASYRFNDLFTLGAYYSETYPDKDDKDGDNQAVDHNAWEKDLAVTLRFDITDNWVAKIEGHSVSGTANVSSIDNTDADYTEEDWYYGAAKLTFSF